MESPLPEVIKSESLVSVLAEGAIYLTLFIFTVYVIIYGYHWFQYGSSQKTSSVALTIYILGGVLLFTGLIISYRLF